MAVTHAVVLANRLVLESGNKLRTETVMRIHQTLAGLAAIGVREAVVVDGRHAESLRDRLNLHEFPTMSVRVLANTSWKNLSGSAVLLARKWIEDAERCLIVRGELPLSLSTLRLLADAGDQHDDIDAAILVAPNVDANPGAEVRVRLAHESDTGLATAVDLGEDLEEADGVFTGHALVDRRILAALAELPNPTFEHGILGLAQTGRVLALPVDWQWDRGARIPVEDKVTALLETKRLDHYVLLNPGPVNTTATVKSALVHHDVCHRDSIFSELMVSMTGKLRRIFKGTPQHTVVTLTGSGTSAMESALVSTIPSDKRILIIDNGAFGERLVEVANVHEMSVVHLRYAWGEAVNLADVERALVEHRDIAAVAMIHHETSVGLLNPVREIGALCRRHDVLLIVDAVSSLGAEDLDVVRDNIDICYGSANKCLHAVSGAAFLCVSPRVWPRIEKLRPRAYYLDLKRYRRYIDELGQTPFTPAVSTYFALDAACTEFLADGHAERFEMYRRRNAKLRTGLAALGMTSFTNTGAESHSIVTCKLPDGVAFDALYEAVKDRGIILYGCKGVLADRYMQIANMGDLSDTLLDRFLAVLAEEVTRLQSRSRRSASHIVVDPATANASSKRERRVG
jgi:2-aminoethylphosphonate-pyruvate transaminase